MNLDQFTGIVRAIVPTAVTIGVAKGWYSVDTGALIMPAVLALSAAVWSWFTNKPGTVIPAK
jgi:hypothetical protein